MMTDPDDPPWPSPQIKSKGIQNIDSQARAPKQPTRQKTAVRASNAVFDATPECLFTHSDIVSARFMRYRLTHMVR